MSMTAHPLHMTFKPMDLNGPIPLEKKKQNPKQARINWIHSDDLLY